MTVAQTPLIASPPSHYLVCEINTIWNWTLRLLLTVRFCPRPEKQQTRYLFCTDTFLSYNKSLVRHSKREQIQQALVYRGYARVPWLPRASAGRDRRRHGYEWRNHARICTYGCASVLLRSHERGVPVCLVLYSSGMC